MPVQDAVPDILSGFGKPEQFPVFQVDDAFVDQKFHVGRSPPVPLAYEHHRNRLDFSSLDQREYLKQFIESTVATWEGDQCLGS
jgi:hypothetical protein